MSKRHNHAGREYVADRFIELKGQSSSNAFSRVRQSIETQTVQKDLDKLKDELDKISSDGVVTVAEKEALKREWASLQQTYSSINEQFSSDPELSENPSYQAMQKVYKTLSDLMAKILNDMTTDYVGEDAKELSTLFSAVYNYLTICQSTLNSRNEFLRTYSLVVTGDRAILDNTSLVAGIYKAGIEQQNPEFIDAKNYTWQRLDNPDGFTPMNGKQIVLDMDDLPISPCRFSVTWKDNTGEITDSLSVILTLTWGTIKEYAWSNAISDEELQAMMPSAWSSTKPENPSNLKYLWRRESSDNRKTYQYFRETGEQGEQGEQGKPGEPGEPGEDAVFYNIWTDVEVVYGTSNDDLSGWVEGGTATDYSYKYSPTASCVAYKIEMYVDDILVASKVLLYVYDGEQGEPGKPGEAPKYYYKYTKTDDPDAYKGGGILFAYGSKLLAVGSTLLSAGMAGWLDHVPDGIQYQDDFLWTKIVHADGTVDIIPPAKRGAPAKDIRIVASQESYQLTTRGIVKTDYEITFTLERNYINGAAHWDMSPPSGTEEIINGELIPVITGVQSEENLDVFTVTLKARSTIRSFTVSVTCEDAEITRSLRIIGIDGGEESPYYFKVYPLSSSDPVPTYNKSSGVINWNGADEKLPDESPEGPLITGDYILHLFDVYENSEDTTPDREPIPLYYDESSDTWKMLTTDSPYYSETMGTILGDVVAMPDMPVTTGALYGFFQNLAAQNAFITNLFSKNINFTGGIYSGAYEYNEETGKFSNPTNGTGTLITADGQLNAVNASLVGLSAQSASIEGEFKTTDSQGTILSSTKTSTSVSAVDTDSRYIARATTDTGVIIGTPSGTQYVKVAGYSQFFMLDYINNNRVDGGTFYDRIVKGEPSEVYGKVELTSWEDTNIEDFYASWGNVEGVITYGPSADISSWGNSMLDDIEIPLGFSVLSGFNNEITFTQIFEVDGEEVEQGSYQHLSIETPSSDYIDLRNYTFSGYSGTGTPTKRSIKYGYHIWASSAFSKVSMGRVNSYAFYCIDDLVAPNYATSTNAQIDSTQYCPYHYLFIEEESAWNTTEKVRQPVVVKSLASENTIEPYSGPTLTLYDRNKEVICTTSSTTEWVNNGGRVSTSYYQLYRQLLNLGAGYHDLTASSFVRALGSSGTVETFSVNRILIEDHDKYMAYYFFKEDSTEDVAYLRYFKDPAGMLISTYSLSNEYGIYVATSLRGITAASIYPATSTTDIGSSGNKFRHIYSDQLSINTLNIPSEYSTVIPLANGWQMEIREYSAPDPDKEEAMWTHISFMGTYTETPTVYVNYKKSSSDGDSSDQGYCFVKNITNFGCDVAMWSSYAFFALIVGKKG